MSRESDFTGHSMESFHPYGRIRPAFNPSEQMIPRMDYTNKGTIVDNNIGDDMHAENIVEYLLMINTYDRDLDIYPDPFHFNVIFNGASPVTETDTTPAGVITTTRYTGAPNPRIQRIFNNVKYVRIDNAILPDTNVIKTDGAVPADQYKLSTDAIDQLDAQKGLVLKIDELRTDRVLGTGSFLSCDSNILYIDNEMGTDNQYWKPTHGLRTYPTSKLLNLKKLTIKLYKGDGTPLEVMGKDGAGIYTPLNMTTLLASLPILPPPDPNFARTNLIASQLRLQVVYEIVLGVIDNEMNTLVKFR